VAWNQRALSIGTEISDHTQMIVDDHSAVHSVSKWMRCSDPITKIYC